MPILIIFIKTRTPTLFVEVAIYVALPDELRFGICAIGKRPEVGLHY